MPHKSIKLPTTNAPTTPTTPVLPGTTGATGDKIARRQVIRDENDRLKVVFVDVKTNKIITDLTGYKISSADIGGSSPTLPSAPAAPVSPTYYAPANDDEDGSASSGSGDNSEYMTPAPPYGGGDRNTMLDGIGGFISKGVDWLDNISGKTAADQAKKTDLNENMKGRVSPPANTPNATSPSSVTPPTQVPTTRTPLDSPSPLEFPNSPKAGVASVGSGQPNTEVTALPKVVADNPVATYLTEQMKNAGYSDVAISAALAHAKNESSFNIGAIGDGGDAYGLFQWNDRKDDLMSWTAANNLDYRTVEGQTAFYLHELNTTEKASGNALKAATDIASANNAMSSYERFSGWNVPGNAEKQQRLSDGQKLLGEFSKVEQTPVKSQFPEQEPLTPAQKTPEQLQSAMSALQKVSSNVGGVAPTQTTLNTLPVNNNGNSQAKATAIATDEALNGIPMSDLKQWHDPDLTGIRPGIDPLPSGVGPNIPRDSNGLMSFPVAPVTADPVGVAPTIQDMANFGHPFPMGKMEIPNPMQGEIPSQYKEAYLETINKSLGSPSANTTFGGATFSDISTHPNTKTFVGDGSTYTTAAGYGGLTFGAWQEYAPKVGAKDFSLESQKNVMWAMATDNYNKSTGRDLQIDLMSGNRDAISSTLVNNSNLWGTLPGGNSSSIPLNTAVNDYITTAKSLAGSVKSSVGADASNLVGSGKSEISSVSPNSFMAASSVASTVGDKIDPYSIPKYGNVGDFANNTTDAVSGSSLLADAAIGRAFADPPTKTSSVASQGAAMAGSGIGGAVSNPSNDKDNSQQAPDYPSSLDQGEDGEGGDGGSNTSSNNPAAAGVGMVGSGKTSSGSSGSGVAAAGSGLSGSGKTATTGAAVSGSGLSGKAATGSNGQSGTSASSVDTNGYSYHSSPR